MTVAQALDVAAERYVERPLVLTDEHEYSYAEIQETSRRIAAGLIELGVKPGDKVAMVVANYPQFVTVKFGISAAGATAIPVNYLFRSAELKYVLHQSEAVALVTMDRFRDLDYVATLDEIAPGWEENGGGDEKKDDDADSKDEGRPLPRPEVKTSVHVRRDSSS